MPDGLSIKPQPAVRIARTSDCNGLSEESDFLALAKMPPYVTHK